MLPDNPNLIAAFEGLDSPDLIGKRRETFALNQLSNAGHLVFYSQKGDIATHSYTFEIGGKNKTKRQLEGVENAFVLADDVLTSYGETIPLYLLGFLY
jgi:uncharacterized protein